jgi:hypothetical protein
MGGSPRHWNAALLWWAYPPIAQVPLLTQRMLSLSYLGCGIIAGHHPPAYFGGPLGYAVRGSKGPLTGLGRRGPTSLDDSMGFWVSMTMVFLESDDASGLGHAPAQATCPLAHSR